MKIDGAPAEILVVHWRDANSVKGYFSTDDARDAALIDLVTAGIFVAETDDAVIVAVDWCGGDGRQEQWRDVHAIPKVNILWMKKVKV